MKRRNAESGKLRRSLKRNKIAESIYGGSTFVYLKFLLAWGLVLVADFVLEFRFEYLWPFWLLLRSVYDSYKYQGLAFSMFFICIALTTDMLCLLFLPVHWMFFAASTYVWVQFVWHTDRGVCVPTVIFWLLIVIIEAKFRLQEVKSALPFHLDLCRPFAAHCIGYPVVTLGFGFKSYVSYRMQQRKKKEVEEENRFFVHVLQQALPPDLQLLEKQRAAELQVKPSEETTTAEAASTNPVSSNGTVPYNRKGSIPPISNGTATASTKGGVISNGTSSKASSLTDSPPPENKVPRDNKQSKASAGNNNQPPSSNSGGSGGGGGVDQTRTDINCLESHLPKCSNNQHHQQQQQSSLAAKESLVSGDHVRNRVNSNPVTSPGGSASGGGSKTKNGNLARENGVAKRKNLVAARNENGAIPLVENNISSAKEDRQARYDLKKLKADLVTSHHAEQELRHQLSSLVSSEKTSKQELEQLRQDNEMLQNKLHNLVSQKQQDRQNLSKLEQKLKTEKESRISTESQLREERKNKKAEEAAAAARAVALARAADCTEKCKEKRSEQENEMKFLKKERKEKDERIAKLEKEIQIIRLNEEREKETEVLMSALSAMQDKNIHLESSLSAETRVKLDLFSALGEAKRLLEITQAQLAKKEQELHELKSRMAEAMALLPQTSYTATTGHVTPPSLYSVVSYNSPVGGGGLLDHGLGVPLLDPNASQFQPNN